MLSKNNVIYPAWREVQPTPILHSSDAPEYSRFPGVKRLDYQVYAKSERYSRVSPFRLKRMRCGLFIISFLNMENKSKIL